MQIKSLEDINNLKTMVRVIDSTYESNEKAKSMVGGEFEVRMNSSVENETEVYNKDESDYFWFNKKDLQKLTPIEYNGRLVGIGDMVLCNGAWCEVFGYYWYDNDFLLNTAKEKDYSKCWDIRAEEIEYIRPLYTPKPEEIITVGGNKYQLIQE